MFARINVKYMAMLLTTLVAFGSSGCRGERNSSLDVAVLGSSGDSRIKLGAYLASTPGNSAVTRDPKQLADYMAQEFPSFSSLRSRAQTNVLSSLGTELRYKSASIGYFFKDGEIGINNGRQAWPGTVISNIWFETYNAARTPEFIELKTDGMEGGILTLTEEELPNFEEYVRKFGGESVSIPETIKRLYWYGGKPSQRRALVSEYLEFQHGQQFVQEALPELRREAPHTAKMIYNLMWEVHESGIFDDYWNAHGKNHFSAVADRYPELVPANFSKNLEVLRSNLWLSSWFRPRVTDIVPSVASHPIDESLHERHGAEVHREIRVIVEGDAAGSRGRTTVAQVEQAAQAVLEEGAKVKAAQVMERLSVYLGPLAVIVDTGLLTQAIYDDMENKDVYFTETAKLITQMVGSELGSEAGAAIGTFACPGVGTFIGAIVGGFAGFEGGGMMETFIQQYILKNPHVAPVN